MIGKVEDGIALPIIPKRNVYPLKEMKVGDSFWFEGERSRVQQAVSAFQRRTGFKFTIRKIEHGFRIWRIS